jgi:hypothetical protein
MWRDVDPVLQRDRANIDLRKEIIEQLAG